MTAYYRSTVAEFVAKEPLAVVGQLETEYANDGFKQQYLNQVLAWVEFVPLLQAEARDLLERLPVAASWAILLEFPLHRLQRRIDVIVLSSSIIVIEVKVGADHFLSSDERQVEEYCLDLRDFHEGSRGQALFPVLWATDADTQESCTAVSTDLVAPV